MKNFLLQKAGELATLDAIENGLTDAEGLQAYFATEEYKAAVRNYYDMLAAEFAA